MRMRIIRSHAQIYVACRNLCLATAAPLCDELPSHCFPTCIFPTCTVASEVQRQHSDAIFVALYILVLISAHVLHILPCYQRPSLACFRSWFCGVVCGCLCSAHVSFAQFACCHLGLRRFIQESLSNRCDELAQTICKTKQIRCAVRSIHRA